MSRGRRIAIGLLSALAVILFLVVAVAFVATETDWGRERLRRFAVAQLENAAEGEVELRRLEGSLLSEIQLIDFSIADTAGRPFIRADTVSTGYSLWGLISQRIILQDLRLVNAVVVLDKRPDEEWNFVQIFAAEPDTVAPSGGWGDWIEFEDVTLVDSRITVRTEWAPDEDLSPAEQEEERRRTLAGETRTNVEEVPGGYQNVMDFRELNAEFSRILAAHPDTSAIPIDVASFNGIVQPFRPPAAEIRDLAGSFRLDGDSLFFRDVDAVLPDSRLQGAGAYAMEYGDLLLQLEGRPVAFADLRWLYPPLPDEGGGELRLNLQMRSEATHVVAEDMDLQVRESRVTGRLGLTIGEQFLLRDTDLSISQLDTRLVEEIAPDVQIPRHGRLSGDLQASGSAEAMQIDGDIIFDDYAAGRNHVIAVGEVGMGDEITFRDLHVRVDPLQADIVRQFAPDVPLDGTIVGYANLNGSTQQMRLESDLTVHDNQSGTSRVLAQGGIDMREELRLRDLLVELAPLRLDLVREQFPEAPAGATVAGQVRLDGVPQRALQIAGDLVVDDPASGVSRFTAAGGVAFGDAVVFADLNLHADPLQLDLLRPFVEDLPPGATVTGPATLDGSTAGLLQLSADLTLRDPETGASRVAVGGGVRMQDEVVLQDMDVRLAPLQMSLVRAFAPDLPLAGQLEGTATIDGSPSARLRFDADLVHTQEGEISRVTGGGVVAADGPIDVDLRLHPLSLQTVNAFAPQAALRGTASGNVRATGDMSNLRFGADLVFADGGALETQGVVDLQSEEPTYDIDMRLDSLDAAAITARAPAETSLSGTVRAEGRGFDPETMTATLQTDLEGSEVEDFEADEVRLRVAVDDGLASFSSSRIRIGSAEAEFDGSFGLVAGRQGRLEYRIDIDSLHAFAPLVPAADTGVVAPRPAVREEAIAEARAAEVQARRDADVEYLATGRRPDLPPPVDPSTIGEIARDSLAGSLVFEGVVEGNVERLDVEGDGEVEGLVYQGNYVGVGSLSYAVDGIGTETLEGSVDGEFESILASGFALESLAVRANYSGGRYGTGEIEIAANPDEFTDIETEAEFTLSLEGNEVRLNDMSVRLDTVQWQTTQPGVISWGGEGVQVQTLELQSNIGGRIYADGDLPVEGPTDMEIVIDRLNIANAYMLLQEDTDAAGLLSLDATIEGSSESPIIEGRASLVEASFDGEEVPDVEATFAYADQEMTAGALLRSDGQELAVLDARIPVELSLVADDGPRLLDREMEVDLRAERVPLDALPAFTDQVEQVEGSVGANFSLRGTPENPITEGQLTLALESLLLVPIGVRFDRIVGAVNLEDDVLTVDSLVAWSEGPLRITGQVELESLSNPVLDLEATAREVWVIDTDDATLQVDADLTATGPADGIVVEGEVRTRRGVIYIPELAEMGSTDVVDLDDPDTFERVDTILTARREAVLDRSPLLENLQVRLDLVVDRDVWLRSTEANVEIYTPPEIGPLQVQMRGVADQLTLEGTINTDRGEYEFMSRRFALNRGSVVFQGGENINPVLQIAADHEVRIPGREPINIRIVLGGTVQDLEITLESDAQPPLAQTDLLSFLAFGREANTLLQQQGSGLSGQGSASGGLVGNVAALAAQQYAAIALEGLVAELERDVGRAVGLDVIRITPADLPAEIFTGSYWDVLRGTEIELGSYVSPRLFVAGQARPTFVQPGVRVEYRTPSGYEWTTSWRPRYLPSEPTLVQQDPASANVFGSFLFREWRF